MMARPGRRRAPRRPLLVCVGSRSDPLVAALTDVPAHAAAEPCVIEPASLADVAVELSPSRVQVDGRPLYAVVFRCPPHTPHSAAFVASDREFCDAEVRATWLAIVHHPQVRTLDAHCPDVWFERSEWSFWRRALARAGLPLAPTDAGRPSRPDTIWHPFLSPGAPRPVGPRTASLLGAITVPAASLRRSIVLCGEVFAGPDGRVVTQAAAVLAEHGVRLAGIVTDSQDRVCSATSWPGVDEALARRLAPRILGALDDHPVRG